MATCDNGHVPITFEGEFSALCPLCNLAHVKIEEAQAAKQAALEDVDGMQGELEAAEARRDEISREYAEYRKTHPEAK
jgi:hypothetical protein